MAAIFNMKSNKTLDNNVTLYSDYYNKPSWWFKVRYESQFKKYTSLSLLSKQDVEWHDKTILELGFGSGDILFSFPSDNYLIGAELSESAIKKAKKKAEKKNYKKTKFYDIRQSPDISQLDEKIDLVIASHVLEHVGDDELIIRQAFDALKSNGLFLVVVPIHEVIEEPNHVRTYSIEKLIDKFVFAGYQLIDFMENGAMFNLLARHREGLKTRWIIAERIYSVLTNFIFFPFVFICPTFLDRAVKKIFKEESHQCVALFQKSMNVHSQTAIGFNS